MIVDHHFKNYELFLHQKRRDEKLLQKFISRKRLKSISEVLDLIKEDALTAMTEKRQKEDELITRRKHNNYMRF
jgi:hypothetical protein